MKIAVLAGGYSPERDVSLVSGSLIANALSRCGHKVFLIDVYEGIDSLPADIENLFRENTDYSYKITESEPDLFSLKRRLGNREALIGPHVLDICSAADVIFLALHGAIGENGQLQATLDTAGIKHYTGSGYAGSLLAMDKNISKKLLRYEGVPTADWIMVENEPDVIEKIEAAIGYPCVIKPNACGSSCGVSIVNDGNELKNALSYAFRYESIVMAEKKITGRELTCAILDGEVLPAVEIIPKTGFYDYINKYQGSTTEICPAPISEEVKEKLGDYVRAGFKALNLSDYARFDFILDTNGKLWCLEANTLPGMTPVSLLPQEAAAAGITYENLCCKIADLALKKIRRHR